MSKVFIWANSDMDGACSTILLRSIFPNSEYRSVFFGDFSNQYEAWESELDEYDKVFIVGLVLNQSLINKMDDSRLVFISDRDEKLTAFDSTLVLENSTSCSKMIYKMFKNKVSFSDELKLLTLYVDDYNSYALKYKESKYLNGVYRNIKYNRFVTFVNRFSGGYDGLTDSEMSKAESFFSAIQTEYEEMEKFVGEYRGWSVIAAFSKLPVNEIAKKLIDNHDSEVIIIVNLDTQFVSFRKPHGSPADIVYLSEKLCNGGGGEYASGGNITDKFLEFTTTLTKYD